MRTRCFFEIVFVILLLSSCAKQDGSVSYDCDNYGKTQMPSWVKNGGNHNANEFEGVGVAHKSRNGMQDQMNSAYNAAVEQMSRSVEATVETSIWKREEYSNGQLRSEDVEQRSHHYTNLFLRGVSRKAQWIDSDSCTIWILVVADKAKIESIFAEKWKLDKAEDYYNSALKYSANIDEKVNKFDKAIDAVKTVNFDVLASSMADGGYNFYFSKYAFARKKIIDDVVAKNNYLFDKSSQNLDRAKTSMNDLFEVERALKDALSSIDEIEMNSKYFFKDLKEIKEKRDKIVEEYNSRVNFLRTLNIGMSIDEVRRHYGSPEEERKEFFLFGGSKGLKYGSYWLIFKRDNLDCIVNANEFRPIGKYDLNDCKDHKRDGVSLVKD